MILPSGTFSYRLRALRITNVQVLISFFFLNITIPLLIHPIYLKTFGPNNHTQIEHTGCVTWTTLIVTSSDTLVLDIHVVYLHTNLLKCPNLHYSTLVVCTLLVLESIQQSFVSTEGKQIIMSSWKKTQLVCLEGKQIIMSSRKKTQLVVVPTSPPRFSSCTAPPPRRWLGSGLAGLPWAAGAWGGPPGYGGALSRWRVGRRWSRTGWSRRPQTSVIGEGFGGGRSHLIGYGSSSQEGLW